MLIVDTQNQKGKKRKEDNDAIFMLIILIYVNHFKDIIKCFCIVDVSL